MRIGVLTSVETRHRYFAQAVRRQFNVVAVGYEETGYSPAVVDHAGLTPAEVQTVAEHFAERARQEEAYFSHDAEFIEDGDACAVRYLSPGGSEHPPIPHTELRASARADSRELEGIPLEKHRRAIPSFTLNMPETLAFLEAAGVDTVVVYGTNLVRPPLLGRWPGRMINLHLGLSPYYRGTATNFYPLLNEEPEYVGATIHLLDAGIDSGAILRHARPKIVADDMPHTIGCKAIQAGIEALFAVLHDLEEGKLEPVPQWKVDNPHLYLRKDYHSREVVELYLKINAGLIARYMQRAADVAPRVRLIE